jgi:hypothetical protein
VLNEADLDPSTGTQAGLFIWLWFNLAGNRNSGYIGTPIVVSYPAVGDPQAGHQGFGAELL